jgi:hypothetical protein
MSGREQKGERSNLSEFIDYCHLRQVYVAKGLLTIHY